MTESLKSNCEQCKNTLPLRKYSSLTINLYSLNFPYINQRLFFCTCILKFIFFSLINEGRKEASGANVFINKKIRQGRLQFLKKIEQLLTEINRLSIDRILSQLYLGCNEFAQNKEKHQILAEPNSQTNKKIISCLA
ncbi:hypothetical protein ABPG74_017222 [Tetrahymena malaccensis]